MVDGYGVLHPRRCGVASHLGVLTQQPTIGVAKSPLVWGPKHTTPADAPSEGVKGCCMCIDASMAAGVICHSAMP